MLVFLGKHRLCPTSKVIFLLLLFLFLVCILLFPGRLELFLVKYLVSPNKFTILELKWHNREQVGSRSIPSSTCACQVKFRWLPWQIFIVGLTLPFEYSNYQQSNFKLTLLFYFSDGYKDYVCYIRLDIRIMFQYIHSLK